MIYRTYRTNWFFRLLGYGKWTGEVEYKQGFKVHYDGPTEADVLFQMDSVR